MSEYVHPDGRICTPDPRGVKWLRGPFARYVRWRYHALDATGVLRGGWTCFRAHLEERDLWRRHYSDDEARLGVNTDG